MTTPKTAPGAPAAESAASPVLSRFAEMVSRYPDTPACQEGDKKLTFSELDAMSSALAAELLRVGQGNRSPVGMFLDLSWRVLPAFLAAAKAGIPYVPLDLSWPEKRMQRVLDIAGCRMLAVMPGKEAPNSVSAGRALVPLDGAGAAQAELPKVPANTPLYIIFTSGSTGDPKGVAVSHANTEQFCTAWDFPGYVPGSRVTACISLAFDVSVAEVWGGMLNGCTVVYTGKNTFLDARRCLAYFRDNSIDYAVLPASVFNILTGQDPHIFGGLKKVILAGEQPNSAMCARALAAAPPGALYNAYGPTECTVFATIEEIRSIRETEVVPAGYPMTGVTIQIVDENMRIIPQGEWGEVLIGGPGVSLGYYNDPDRTRAVFVPDPEAPSRIVYKTGDQGRLDETGKLTLSGRFDDQVKISGARVELGEIRLMINAAPMVLIGHALYDPAFGLIAYAVKAPDYEHLDDAALHDELCRHLSGHLPPYALPKHTIAVERMPLNSSGKVHGAALPRPAPALSAPSSDSPVLDAFREALLNRAFDAEDAFLACGGNSLLAARLVGDLYKLTGVWVPLEMFVQPKTARLVELYVSSAGQAVSATLEEIHQEVRF